MSVNMYVPELRFGEFSEEWKEKNIGNILTIGSGKDYKHLKSGNIPVYGTGGYMTSVDEYLYDGESVCIGRKGTIDKPVFISGKFWTVDTLFYTHSFKKSIPKFVYLIFQRINWKKYNEASGVPSLSKSTIEKIKIKLPSKTEQEKIASFLSSVDSKIEQLTKKKILFEQYKKGVIQKIFSQEIRFKADDGSDYPEWIEKKLEDVSTFKNGKPYEPDVVENGALQLITLDSISIKGQLKKKHKTVNIDDKSLRKGDIVIVLSDIAHAKLLGLSDVIPNNNFVLNQRMGRIRMDDSCDSKFASYLINYNQKFFRRRGQGTSQKHIYERDIKALIFNKPRKEEQTKIANFLSSLDTKISQIDQQLEATKQFKKALLQKMFV